MELMKSIDFVNRAMHRYAVRSISYSAHRGQERQARLFRTHRAYQVIARACSMNWIFCSGHRRPQHPCACPASTVMHNSCRRAGRQMYHPTAVSMECRTPVTCRLLHISALIQQAAAAAASSYRTSRHAKFESDLILAHVCFCPRLAGLGST